MIIGYLDPWGSMSDEWAFRISSHQQHSARISLWDVGFWGSRSPIHCMILSTKNCGRPVPGFIF